MRLRPLAAALVSLVLLAVAVPLGAGADQRGTPARAPAPRRDTPPLVVLVVVDQFRGDYVQWYGARWTKGLRRLIDHGAYFPLAAYPYAVTLTCAGHATIGTGAFPRTHGMIANEWYDRETKKSIPCTDDPGADAVAFGGGAGREHHGPKRLATNTFADELRNQAATPPKITSVSLKARSAIGMAGHAGDVVTWFEDSGVIASSTAFMKASRPELDQFAEAHAPAKQYGRVWDRLLPPSAYLFTDDGLNEYKAEGVTTTFPHPQTRPNGQADRTFVVNWERTPFGDEALADAAITFSEGYGAGPGTDFLAVSFTGLDCVGHRYGPKSHEVQDLLLRLDIQIGRLLDTLDRRLGPNGYVLALSADHGVAPIPEQVTAVGLDAGRLASRDITARLVEAWKPFATDAVSPIANNNGTDIYFTPAALAVLGANAAARQALADAARTHPGVLEAYWPAEITAASSDPVRQALALSYFPGRSADLQLVLKAHWMVGTASSATHGTPYEYDQRVPVILYGWGVRPGRYLTTATPADIAPSFGYLTHVNLPRAEGRVLGEAIR